MQIEMYNEIPEFRSNNLAKKHLLDAGYDIRAAHNFVAFAKNDAIVCTGLHINIPPGYCGIIQSRSGHAIKSSIEVSNGGVIDAGYHGEIRLKIYNNSFETISFRKGDRIAQIVFQKVPDVQIVERDMESWISTDRGKKGFGSSGQS